MADENEDNGEVAEEVKRTELDDDRRKACFTMLLGMVKDGALRHGALAEAAAEFGISRWTCKRIWIRGLNGKTPAQISPSDDISSVSSKRKNCGRVALHDHEELAIAIKAVPAKRRRTLRELEAALKVPRTTLHRMLKSPDSLVCPKTKSLERKLTEENKVDRIAYCLDKRGENGRYSEMLDTIHIDVKWFNVDEASESNYTVEGPKVKFISALARPRYDNNAQREFDGKIGIWPFVELRPAERNSRSRPRGTMSLYNVSVTAEVYLRMIVGTVLPAIAQKCPAAMKARKIILQQENAPTHAMVHNQNAEIIAKLAQLGLDVEIRLLPANSPDLNINDLSFFREIQSLQYKTVTTTKEELVPAVTHSFEMYNKQKIDDAFLTLMCCMNEILQRNGSNDYEIPHMGKKKMERIGMLPRSIDYTHVPNVLEDEINMLAEEENGRDDDAGINNMEINKVAVL